MGWWEQFLSSEPGSVLGWSVCETEDFPWAWVTLAGQACCLLLVQRNLKSQRSFWCEWKDWDHLRHREPEKILNRRKTTSSLAVGPPGVPTAPQGPFRWRESPLTLLFVPIGHKVLSHKCFISFHLPSALCPEEELLRGEPLAQVAQLSWWLNTPELLLSPTRHKFRKMYLKLLKGEAPSLSPETSERVDKPAKLILHFQRWQTLSEAKPLPGSKHFEFEVGQLLTNSNSVLTCLQITLSPLTEQRVLLPSLW